MTMTETSLERPPTVEDLQAEIAELARRLEEAEETVHAIQSGAVDAFVVEKPDGCRIYTLESADRPYRLMVEQMQQGAATLLADGTIVYCNRRLAELLGTPHQRLIGAALRDFIDENERTAYDGMLAGTQYGSAGVEARLRRKDGGMLPALLTFNNLPEDCGATMGVLVTDLTTQKHHEQLTAAHQALCDSEERFRELANNIDQFAWTCDELGHATWYNRRWYEYTGTTFEEMQGDGWKRIHHPAHLGRVLESLRKCRATGESWEDTFLLRGCDGNYRWFLSRAIPIRDASGRVVRWLGTNTDVTKLRQLEEELRNADRHKDEFLATLAHELRNPLATVMSSLEIISMAGGDQAVLGEVHCSMQRQVAQLVRLVDDLLDVSRITHDKLELRWEKVELASIIQSAVEASRPLADSRRHHVEVDLPADPVELDADPVRLTQAFANLAHNACKFTEPGGRIALCAEVHGEDVVVRVKDSGIGIAPDKLSQVFGMFKQVEHSASRSPGGLGIGLTLAKRLVEIHGGSLSAHSEGLGHGSEFVVRLPVRPQVPHTRNSPEKTGAASPVPARRILVVDDNRDAAASLALLLRFAGHETRAAHDGLEALQAAEQYRPDVLVLDIGLPGIDGLEVARRIRQEPWGKSMALIAVSGWGQDEDRKKSKEAGFNGHLVKPVAFGALTNMLAECPAIPG